jgi:bifunctional DNA-binding transcriptional regulator/antitoxin component of YhaV-PrlF toxin-antitoxin module
MTTVGTKYQVVIEREARERLGIQPGWEAVQAVVGDRLEVRFLPPEHERSLAGSLRRYAKGRASDYGAEKREGWEAEVSARRSRAGRRA